MKKTTSIHLMGTVFNIEEDAYLALSHYLDQIRLSLNSEEGTDEIMEDIEMRIAELFQERLHKTKAVITTGDLNQVIAILGQPTAFGNGNEEDEGNEKNQEAEEKSFADPKVKRLYRDDENGTIGGVCSGLGHYFDIDPIIFRIIFAGLFLFFGTGILLYILLIVFIPAAKTTADKIEMRGKPVNLDSIKDHFNQFAESIAEKTNTAKIKSTVRNTVNKGWEKSRLVFEVLSKIIGAAFIVGGLIAFIFLISIFFTDTGLIPFIGEDRIPDLYSAIEIVYPSNKNISLIFASIVVICLIPAISFIITGARIITKNRVRIKEFTWVLSVIWIIAVVWLTIQSISIINDRKGERTIKETIELADPTANILTVDANEDALFSNHLNPNKGYDFAELIRTDKNYIYIGVTGLKIVSSPDTGNFEFYLHRHARGKNDENAIDIGERIEFELKSDGTTLLIPPYIRFPKEDKVRGQYLRFTLVVPKGKSIKFGPQIDRLKLNKNNYDSWTD